MRRHIAVTLLALAASCKKSAADERVAAPPAPAGPTTKVDVQLDKEFFGTAHLELTGLALLYIDDPGFELRFYNAKANATCETEPDGGKGVKGDGFALALQGSGFPTAPGKVDELGWSLYYRSKLSPEGTNSGNGADHSRIHLAITKLAGDTAIGEVSGTLDTDGTEKIGGTFVAKICRRPEPTDSSN